MVVELALPANILEAANQAKFWATRFRKALSPCRVDEEELAQHQPYDETLQVASEWYDSKKDPLETRNLAADPEYAIVLKKMRRHLLDFFGSQAKRWQNQSNHANFHHD